MEVNKLRKRERQEKIGTWNIY